MTPKHRRPILISGLLAIALTGCASPPDATPTPGFASEAEAFAAAEKTYRAYVDALNERRRNAAAPDPQIFLVGQALELDIDTQRNLSARELTIVGPTTVLSVSSLGMAADSSGSSVEVCLDSSDTRVLDASGNDVTPGDRATRARLVVTTVLINDNTLIAKTESGSEESC